MNRFVELVMQDGNAISINPDHFVDVSPHANGSIVETTKSRIFCAQNTEQVKRLIKESFIENSESGGTVTGRNTHITMNVESVDKFNNVKNFQVFAHPIPHINLNPPFSEKQTKEGNRRDVERLLEFLNEDSEVNEACLYGVPIRPIVRGYLDKVPDPSISLKKIMDGFDSRQRELDQICGLKNGEDSEIKEFGYKYREGGALHTAIDFGNIRKYFEKEISKLIIADKIRIKWLENKMKIAAKDLSDSAETDP